MTQTKDLDSHAPAFVNGNGNGVLYEDLAHARPRPPMAPPSIEVSSRLLFICGKAETI